MEKEQYWDFLIDILINIGRQNEKDKLKLCENSIGPKQPEQLLPFSLWTYHQAWKTFWKINVSSVSNLLYKNRIDSTYRTVRYGLQIIVEKLGEDDKLEKLCENIWTNEDLFPVDETTEYCSHFKGGWLYNDFEGVVEIIELSLVGNLFVTDQMVKQILEMQKEFEAKEAAEHQRICHEIEEWKRQNDF